MEQTAKQKWGEYRQWRTRKGGTDPGGILGVMGSGSDGRNTISSSGFFANRDLCTCIGCHYHCLYCMVRQQQQSDWIYRTIQAVGSEFDLAAAVTSKNKGVHDGLLDAQPGTDIKLSEVDYASTDGEHTSVTWAITENSNVNNKTETGINPGSN